MITSMIMTVSNDDSKWDNDDDHSKKSSSENDNKDLITSTKPGRLWPDSPSEVSCESTRRNCTRNRGSPWVRKRRRKPEYIAGTDRSRQGRDRERSLLRWRCHEREGNAGRAAQASVAEILRRETGAWGNLGCRIIEFVVLCMLLFDHVLCCVALSLAVWYISLIIYFVTFLECM